MVFCVWFWFGCGLSPGALVMSTKTPETSSEPAQGPSTAAVGERYTQPASMTLRRWKELYGQEALDKLLDRLRELLGDVYNGPTGDL